MASRSLPRKERVPTQTPRRSLRTQSANKKLVSKPTQSFTRHVIPKKQSSIPQVITSEVQKKPRTFSFKKKPALEKTVQETKEEIEKTLPEIAKNLDTEKSVEVTTVSAPVKPLKRQHVSLLTSMRAVTVAAVVAISIVLVVGFFSLRVGRGAHGGIYATSKLSYVFSQPERFDTILVRLASDAHVLAQVVALPGEDVFERSDGVFIQTKDEAAAFSLAMFASGDALVLKALDLEGKQTRLSDQLYYILPEGELSKGQFIAKEAIIGRVLWDRSAR